MKNRQHVDPELYPLIEQEFLPGLCAENLTESRAFLADMLASLNGKSPAARSEHMAPGRDGHPDVRMVVHTPPGDAEARPAILFIHGGGLVLGDANMGEGADGALALQHQAVVAAVDYRLAPETPFPGAVEDCLAGLTWLHDQADALHIDTSRIVLLGESAGGGLAASLALLSRDSQGPHACAQFLIYPMLDNRTGSDSDPHNNPAVGHFAWTRAHNRFGWSSYQGSYDLHDERIGHFSAARAVDLTTLPPAFLAVGSLDLFFDEVVDYARRLSAARVPVELHSYPGAVHVFDSMATAWVAQSFKIDFDRALRRVLGTHTAGAPR